MTPEMLCDARSRQGPEINPAGVVAAGASGTYWPTIGLTVVRNREVTSMQNQETRPFGVTAIGTLLAIHGVIAGLAGLGVFGPIPRGPLGPPSS